MKKLLFIMAVTISCMAQASQAQPAKRHNCAKYKDFRTQVIFNTKVLPTRYNFTRSTKQLSNEGRERLAEWRKQHADHAWVSGSKAATGWHTQGVAVGSVKVGAQSALVAKPYDKYGMNYCPYVQKVIVDLEYETEIFIAKEHKKGTCKFNAVMEHELKHHDTNVVVFETLAKRMEADMPKFIAFMEESYIPKSKVQKSFQDLRAGLQDALKVYMKEITDRKEEFNAYIDTPEEYKRVGSLCKK